MITIFLNQIMLLSISIPNWLLFFIIIIFFVFGSFRKYPYLSMEGFLFCTPGNSSLASYSPYEFRMTLQGVGMDFFWNCTFICCHYHNNPFSFLLSSFITITSSCNWRVVSSKWGLRTCISLLLAKNPDNTPDLLSFTSTVEPPFAPSSRERPTPRPGQIILK